MPSTTVKNLYLASTIKELEAKHQTIPDVKNKNASQVLKSADKVFETAESSYLSGDEERAYVLYTRFVELLLLARKKADYERVCQDSSIKRLYELANIAIGKAEILKDSLSERYNQQATTLKQKNEKNEMLSELHKKPPTPSEAGDDKISISPTPKIKEQPKLSISSQKLHSMLPSSTFNIIIMDTRLAEDFEESHIKHSRCISIPQEILEPGVTAMKLESILPSASLSQWYQRANADYIILMDWDSKDETSESIHIQTLKTAMCKWDQKCTLKRPPLVLQNGYKDWMLKYPMFTTKPLNFTAISEVGKSPSIADVSAVQYPNLDENNSDSPSNKENFSQPDSLFKKSSLPNQIKNGDASMNISAGPKKVKSAPNVDRKLKPTIVGVPKSSGSERKSISGKSNRDPLVISPTQENLPSSVNPKAKPTPKSPDPDDLLVKSLDKEANLAEESLELAKEQLRNEYEFEKLRLRKELEAEESMRMEIQKQEDLLHAKMKEMESQAQQKDEECAKVKEENLRLKKELAEKKNADYQNTQEKKIADHLKEKKALLDDVARLREERKKKEALSKRKVEVSKSTSVPRDSVSASTGLKRNNNTDSSKHGNSEYTIPLSRQGSEDTSSCGLVRSHSSPNIAQMVNQEESARGNTPVIDRTLKPNPPLPPYMSALASAWSRNLNPVYGNCPARPVTGLKNLGNTCFMNSIIQCLSNTTPLAEYINSGMYVNDINRHCSQGTNGELAEEFAVVIKSLWMGQYKFFSPKDFKNTVSRCLSVCIGNEQQDSHEFLVVLMEKLHADLNKKYMRSSPKLEASTVDENTFWQHHKSYNCSKISDVFEGLLKSTLTCLSCRKTSDSFEVFSCLSLPIMTSRCTLKDCVQHFLKSEKISGEAAWDCPRCKQKKEAEKRLRICRLPEILVIQLKRFSYDGLWRKKLQTAVDFDFTFDVPCEENSEERFRSYSLYGVVNHYGTLEGGHYIAYCKTVSRKWYKYDDHEVSEINALDVKTPAAYLLFYQATDYQSRL
ncbi:ubiquitin carboxyl-terminal hydrolase 8-like [Uloborus diversus]|uniref:ubiquitin carboxyl-terminal hydrolase 8-like n=1 Tax=Uloborus diversus TaxID=327109 RepID=UPI0024097051|nr:ubiquitin carboxyl-terminal hydrolase 8-like [Uloborus diversus]